MNYISNTSDDVLQMLNEISHLKNQKLSSIEELFMDIPGDLRSKPLNLPGPFSEIEVYKKIKEHANKTLSSFDYKSFMGGGSYNHFIPAAVNTVISRSDFYTAYTPYQPEVSQGTLISIFEYQTMICNLTGMEVSNASHYDGATALAESMIMAYNITDKTEFLVASSINPMYKQVLQTYAQAAGYKLIFIPFCEQTGILDKEFIKNNISSSTAAVIVQNPSFFGIVEDFEWLSKLIHENNGLFIVSVNPISLGILKSPASYGADIVCGDGQPLGIPSSFGGPSLGFMATLQKYVRKLPGRIVGETVDRNGKRAFVLTLQAREQHIRREKASSNICTNQALCALAATTYLSYLGPKGLYEVAKRCSDLSHYLAQRIIETKKFKLKFNNLSFFHEFIITYPNNISFEEIFDHFVKHKILPGIDTKIAGINNGILVCTTEMLTKDDVDEFVKCLEAIKC